MILDGLRLDTIRKSEATVLIIFGILKALEGITLLFIHAWLDEAL